MFLPDSNTFSEIVQPIPNDNVIKHYLNNLAFICVATIVWQEMCFGYHLMPEGKKKAKIHEFLFGEIAEFPLLNYDKKCADIHAKIRADCQKKGKTLSYSDSQIASIALAYDLTVVTRNVSDFEHIENLKIINWFD